MRLLIPLIFFSLTFSMNIFSQNDKIRIEFDKLSEEFIIKKLYLDSLIRETDSLKALSEELDSRMQNCGMELYNLTGLTSEEIDNYRIRLELLEKESKNIITDKENFLKEFSIISHSKALCLPEFSEIYNKILSNPNIVLLLEEEPKTISTGEYIVVEGDNLWKIAGERLNNPYLWRKIYYANRDIISKRFIIYPGMHLIIPQIEK